MTLIPQQPPCRACLADTKTVQAAVATLIANGIEVKHPSRDAYEARDGDTVVYRALQKGYKMPWLVVTRNSDRVTWGDSNGSHSAV